MKPQYKLEHFYGNTLTIEFPNGNSYNYQNFSPNETLTLYSKLHNFLPFEVQNLVEQLEIGSNEIEIRIANTSEARALLKAQGEVRKSLITLRTLFPEDEDSPVDEVRSQVASYAINKGYISFKCTSSVDLLQGVVPTVVFDAKKFPHLPYFNELSVKRGL